MSRGVERELRENYDIGPAPVKIVPNAADLKYFKPIPEAHRLAWRRENGLDAEDVVIIFAGGEWVRKGLDLAIRALARFLIRGQSCLLPATMRQRLPSRRSPPSATWLIGSYLEAFERMCRLALASFGHFSVPQLV